MWKNSAERSEEWVFSRSRVMGLWKHFPVSTYQVRSRSVIENETVLGQTLHHLIGGGFVRQRWTIILPLVSQPIICVGVCLLMARTFTCVFTAVSFSVPHCIPCASVCMRYCVCVCVCVGGGGGGGAYSQEENHLRLETKVILSKRNKHTHTHTHTHYWKLRKQVQPRTKMLTFLPPVKLRIKTWWCHKILNGDVKSVFDTSLGTKMFCFESHPSRYSVNTGLPAVAQNMQLDPSQKSPRVLWWFLSFTVSSRISLRRRYHHNLSKRGLLKITKRLNSHNPEGTIRGVQTPGVFAMTCCIVWWNEYNTHLQHRTQPRHGKLLPPTGGAE